ncbi:hypothetical protein BDV93DRAFT_514770 [Ceratobasidium sp. AG-I]|nr:hypothetical protein BDV93DRAFT_514770 [Ceratobasidium sp. AG-I]
MQRVLASTSEVSIQREDGTAEKEMSKGEQKQMVANPEEKAAGSEGGAGGYHIILDNTGIVQGEVDVQEDDGEWGLPPLGVAHADNSIIMTKEGLRGERSVAMLEPYNMKEICMFSSVFHGESSDKLTSLVTKKGGKAAYRNQSE